MSFTDQNVINTGWRPTGSEPLTRQTFQGPFGKTYLVHCLLHGQCFPGQIVLCSTSQLRALWVQSKGCHAALSALANILGLLHQ